MIVVVVAHGFAPMLLASFLANDAAASFDERRPPPERGRVKLDEGKLCRQRIFGAPSPGGFFGALSVLDAVEPGGMSSRYGANCKTGRGLPTYWRP